MKFKCKDCGKIYENQKPDFCECGNDEFIKMRTKAEREAQIGSASNEKSEEKKDNPIFMIIFLLTVIAVVWFILTTIRAKQEEQPDYNDAYLTEVRQTMLKDFDPEGITNSGYCIISFEITPDGRITKKRMDKQSPIREINDKVMGMLILADKADPPPKAYTNTPIRIEFGCIADNAEVECYSKNIVEKIEK